MLVLIPAIIVALVVFSMLRSLFVPVLITAAIIWGCVQLGIHF